jgi:hypothetical protein
MPPRSESSFAETTEAASICRMSPLRPQTIQEEEEAALASMSLVTDYYDDMEVHPAPAVGLPSAASLLKRTLDCREGMRACCDLMDENEHLKTLIQTLKDPASNDKNELTTMLSTLTSALALAHQHIRQLAAVTSSPEENVKAMSEFLCTHHNAHITFRQ